MSLCSEVKIVLTSSRRKGGRHDLCVSVLAGQSRDGEQREENSACRVIGLAGQSRGREGNPIPSDRCSQWKFPRELLAAGFSSTFLDEACDSVDCSSNAGDDTADTPHVSHSLLFLSIHIHLRASPKWIRVSAGQQYGYIYCMWLELECQLC